MDVACEYCQAKFKIPDEKVPQNQLFAIACPKCKNKISIDTRVEGGARAPVREAGEARTLVDEVVAGSYDASDKPFDFIEEGALTALICESDEGVGEKIKAALVSIGYHTTTPGNARETLKRMRFHQFDMVVINERFDATNPDQNNILRYIERLGMDVRRNMYVVLVTGRFRTMDNMIAFNKSVNLTVNLSNIDDLEKIIRRGLAENDVFYKVFRESLQRVGRN